MVILLETLGELEPIDPQVFSLEQRLMFHAYFVEHRACFDEIKDYRVNAQARGGIQSPF